MISECPSRLLCFKHESVRRLSVETWEIFVKICGNMVKHGRYLLNIPPVAGISSSIKQPSVVTVP